MQKINLSFLKIGLEKKVFMPFAVIDLLYRRVTNNIYPSTRKRLISENRWSISDFKHFPQSTRQEIIKLARAADEDNDLDFEMEMRIICALYTLLEENNSASIHLDETKEVRYICEYEFNDPQQVIKEIFLWHRWGISISANEKELLQQVWQKILAIKPADLSVEDFINTKKQELFRQHADLLKQTKRLLKKEDHLTSKLREAQKLRSTRLDEFENLDQQHKQVSNEGFKKYDQMINIQYQLGLLEVYPIIKKFAPEILTQNS